jgi:predicted NAD-dependent protein-ADP-ribosyltransferase YbiA (DUF1768 family)
MEATFGDEGNLGSSPRDFNMNGVNMAARPESDFFFFYGTPFSQWWETKFAVDGVVYNCAEQYMMAEKARLFGDKIMETNIMSTRNPAEQKG